MPEHYLALECTLAAEQSDAVTEYLFEQGALSVDMKDADADTEAEEALFAEPGHVHEDAWRRNLLTALFPSGSQLMPIIQGLHRDFALPTDDISSYEVHEQDWVRLTQAQFGVIAINERMAIVPSWESAPSAHPLIIRLDPGLAFGTGSHPTTHLCLLWLMHSELSKKTVMDYGCGSGILAIAAVKCGAAAVDGLDIDPNAVRAASDNAVHNHVQARFFDASIQELPTYDIVVANILANPLCVLAPHLCGLLKSGGAIALSGILQEQSAQVIAAYAPWVTLSVWQSRDGWVCLSGNRN
ncbi:MAG: hypothetical protein RLZZ502_1548 [Pseudomonadota bacterium]|jgi:ribosomal protein L11 methyltransferase